jgi:TRAP transporter TAXI family solute receptor
VTPQLPLRRRTALGLLAGACLLGGGGWAVAARRTGGAPAGEVVIATGGTLGVYYAYGTTLAAELDRRAGAPRARVLTTTGSIDNLQQLAAGTATLAFAAGDAAAQAHRGGAPFDRRVDVRAIARVYDDYVHLVTRQASSVRDVSDLARRRVSVGSPGSGTALIAERLLEAARLPLRRVEVQRLGINESVRALQDGTVDAFFWSGGLPTRGVVDLAAALPIRLVPLGDLADGMRQRYGPVYRPAAVPSGTYGGQDPITTLAVPNILLCRGDAHPDAVHELTRSLFEAREALARVLPQGLSLDARTAIVTFPVPLHAGAQEYYRAVKP